MPDWLADRTAATPQAAALIIGEECWSYARLNYLVDEMCQRLRDAGILPHQFVAALLNNSLEAVCLVYALARLEAVLIPLNTRLTPAEIEWQLHHTAAAWLAWDDKNAGKLPSLSSPILTLQSPIQFTPLPKQQATNRPTDQATIQAILFTSGTTGRPKGAMITWDNHFYSAIALYAHSGKPEYCFYGPTSKWLAADHYGEAIRL